MNSRQSSRRRFLTMGAIASAAAGLPGHAAAAPAKEGRSAGAKPKISILAYSFRGLLQQGKMDVFGYVESCKYRYGLDAADIWSAFLTSQEDAYLKKIREALDDREMVLADLCVDGAHIWEDSADAREKNYRNALAALKAAQILGARFMRVDAGGRAAWTGEQFDHIVRRYKEYAKFAHDHGFKVGAENHWGPEATLAGMCKLYHAVDHPAFGVSCHVGGWTGVGAAIADREVSPWVCHTHLAWDLCNGPRLEEKLANLWNAGYSGYYSVEHHSAKNEYANVAIQLAKVRAVLERFRTGQSPLIKRAV
jgi:sugar phosphate isomerase/epimerase